MSVLRRPNIVQDAELIKAESSTATAFKTESTCLSEMAEDRGTFVIVGGGIAGVSCAEMLCVLAPNERILLITSSPVIKAVANLSHLTKLLAAFDVQEETADHFQSKHKNLKVIVTDPVEKVLPKDRLVVTASGRQFSYNYLCLCHGARPKVIAKDNPFVLGIRDTESVRQFQNKLSNARRIVIVGNGGIATEMVYELESVDVVWVVKDDSISAAFVDAGAAEFFQSKLQSSASDEEQRPTKRLKYSTDQSGKSGGGALGPDWHRSIETKGFKNSGKRVHVEYDCDIKELQEKSVETGDLGELTKYEDADWNVYVELSNGKVVGCDFVVSATGVVPNSDAIRVEGLASSPDGGIRVNEHMETSVARVYAAGDVCHADWTPSRHWFQMRLWTQARQMGMFAGQCMQVEFESDGKEKKDLDFSFELFAHSTKFFGYKVVLLGLFNGQKDIEYEVLLRVTKGKEYVKTVMSKDGRMQGAVLIGETDLEETFENLILNQMDLSAFGVDLLDPDVDIEDYFD